MPSDIAAITSFVFPLIVILAIALYSIRILREYERGVVFMLGRLWKVKGPGLVIIIPFVQQMVRVDLRTRVFDVPPQDVISRDNVSVRVNAVVYYRIVDPEKAIIQVERFEEATSQLAQTTLRSVLGQHDLDQMLAEREKLNSDIRQILDEQTDAWGIKVSIVELKHVDIKPWCAPSHARRRRNGSGAPKSSTPKANTRQPKSWRRPAIFCPAAPKPCNFAISLRCRPSSETVHQRSSCRSRSKCSRSLVREP
jgi:hypothetical protein